MPKRGEIGARLVSGALELVFVWEEDRFLHRIAWGEACFESVGSADGGTPAYQEVHQQGDVVFASGMSGDRLWSASVEPCPGGFLFDVACRAKTTAEGLALAYRGDDGFCLTSEPEGEVVGDGVLALAPPAGEPPYTLRRRYRITTNQ